MFMNEHLTLLKNSTDLIHALGEQDWEAFSEIWTYSIASKLSQLTSKSEVEKRLYFIIDGVQRIYYEDEQRQATLVFTYRGSFGGILNSFLTELPSPYHYQTLTRSTFLYTTKAQLDAAISKRPEINKLIVKGTGIAMSGLLERLVETQCYSSEEKFRSLLKRSPHILNLVPQKYLANYIGIDPTNFSKLINTIKI